MTTPSQPTSYNDIKRLAGEVLTQAVTEAKNAPTLNRSSRQPPQGTHRRTQDAYRNAQGSKPSSQLARPTHRRPQRQAARHPDLAHLLIRPNHHPHRHQQLLPLRTTQ